MHGGTSGGAPKGSANAATHGTYGKILKGDDLGYYKAALQELMGDTAGALLHDAAVMRAASARTLSRVTSLDDPCIVEEKTVTGINAKGEPIDTKEIKRVSVMGPVSDVLSRAASIAAKAFDIDPGLRKVQIEKIEAETARLKKDAEPEGPREPLEIRIVDYREGE